jgi:hypothetical protein
MISNLVEAMLLYYFHNIASMNDITCKAFDHFLTLGGMSFIKWNFFFEIEFLNFLCGMFWLLIKQFNHSF